MSPKKRRKVSPLNDLAGSPAPPRLHGLKQALRLRIPRIRAQSSLGVTARGVLVSSPVMDHRAIRPSPCVAGRHLNRLVQQVHGFVALSDLHQHRRKVDGPLAITGALLSGEEEGTLEKLESLLVLAAAGFDQSGILECVGIIGVDLERRLE